MRIRKIISGILFFVAAAGCVDSYMPKISKSDAEGLLVVEGRITNDPGPFRIRLSRTVPIGDYDSINPVLKANVRISDDQGHSFRLVDSGKGFYETEEKNLSGVPGFKYTLYITTPDNNSYLSSTVQMLQAPKIDSLYFEEVKHTRIQEGKTYEDTWLNILLDTKDAQDQTKYWLYDFQETWEVNLLANAIKLHHSQLAENYEKVFVRSDDPKKRCWITKPSASLILGSTAKNSINQLTGFPVQTIGPGETKLHVRYSILVSQYALEEELYNYFNKLKEANENTGGLYAKIPTPVFGNITSAEGAKALGYFMASSVTKKRLFITSSEHHLETLNQNSECYYYDYKISPNEHRYLLGYQVLSGGQVWSSNEACTDCTFYGTNVKPSYW